MCVYVIDVIRRRYLCYTTLNYQNLLLHRVPVHSISGFRIAACKEVGFGRLR